MRILITGANGFIGRHLLSFLRAKGHEISALARKPGPEGEGIAWHVWRFGEPIPPEAVEKVEAAVHLAHDFCGEDGARLTVEATSAALARLREAGVRRQLFFSSYSAGTHAVSLYGRTKTALEACALATPGGLVIRPGIVVGDGGLYQRIAGAARRFPVIPLPDGGRGAVPIITIEKLCAQSLKLIDSELNDRVFNLFEPEMMSLRALVQRAAAAAGRHPLILPIPSGLMITGLRLAHRVGLRLPVNADNLEGFLGNQTAVHLSTRLV